MRRMDLASSRGVANGTKGPTAETRTIGGQLSGHSEIAKRQHTGIEIAMIHTFVEFVLARV